jgi:hypothetical protein
MDMSGNHYVKQNQSGIEKQMPHNLTHMWNLIKPISQKLNDRKKEQQGNVDQEILSYS